MAGALLAIGSVSLIVAMAALAGGCTHDPRTIRIDHAGAKGFDSPQELTDYQKQRIVEIILDTPEAKEQPPTESIYRTWLMWTAIVWDNSHYSYMSSFDLEEVESDPEYQTVPESAAWYPGATLYYGDPQAPTAEWLIQAHVDLDAGKVVYINSHPYSAAPLTPPPPGRSSSETAETRTYLTIEELPPPMGEEAPDDIMPTPGGGTYRANVHQSGVENPWPPIESTDVVLGSGSDVLNVSYRDYIKTEAGETRNNTIRIRKEGGLFNSQLALYSVHVPSGIVLTDGGRGVGLPGTLGAILVIEIAQDVAPGEYPLEIGLMINGKYYGTVTCIVKVIESTVTESTDGNVYHSEEAYLTVSLPGGWTAVEGAEYLAHPFEGQVAFNSWGEKNFWAREVRIGSSSTYGPQTVMSQIPEGGAYVALVRIWGPPRPDDYDPLEYTLDDLGELCQPHDWRQNSTTDAQFIQFYKWGRDLRLEIACHPGASDETVDELNNLLVSWRFDTVPAGDIEWAGIQARKLLPEEVEPLKFSNRAGSRGDDGLDRVTEVETGENVMIFRFTYQWDSSSHWGR